MITQISSLDNVYKAAFTAAASKAPARELPQPQDMIEITAPADVKDNFTFNRLTDGLASKLYINGASTLQGKTYGIDYELYRSCARKNTDIKGKIGSKPVDVKRYRKNFWGMKYNIVGYVGDKEINLTESTGFDNSKIKGKFGDEDINFKIYRLQYDRIYSGQGIDMMEQYSYAPFKINAKCTYHGKYQLAPELLPILAALYRTY